MSSNDSEKNTSVSIAPEPVARDVPQSYLPHVAKGAMINLSGALVRTVLLYSYTLLLARVLSTSELGEYFLMFTIINILGLVSTVGLDFGVVRYVALFAGEGKNRTARKTLQAGLWLGVPMGILVATAAFFAAPLVTDALLDGNPDATTGLRIFLISIPFWVAARLCNSATQGMHQMQYQVISRDIGEQVSKFGLSIIAIALGTGLIGVVWANSASVVVAMALSLVFAILIFRRMPADAPAEKIAKRMYRYSFPLAFSNILGMILIWADTLLLGYLGTTSDVGYYGAALRVGSTFSMTLLAAFITVFQPVISDLYNRRQMEELQALFKTVTRWMFICSYPVFLLLALFADPIMRLFGGEFTAGSGALVLLAFGQLVNASTGSAGLMVVMSGRSHMELLNVGAALVANTVICFLLIPRYGVMGAAVANMAAVGIVNVMRMIEVWVFMRVHAYEINYAKPLIAGSVSALAVALISRLLDTGSALMPAVLLAIGLLLFYILLTASLGLDKNDKAVLRMVKNRLAKTGAA